MNTSQSLFALDSSLSFDLSSESEGVFRISGQFFARRDQRIVVGIEQGQGPTPAGLCALQLVLISSILLVLGDSSDSKNSFRWKVYRV